MRPVPLALGIWKLGAVLAIGAALSLTALVAGPLRGERGGTPSANADGGDFSLDFIAAADDDYDHLTSPAVEVAPNGLQFDSRAINTHVVEQLEAEDFACGDTIVFFTQVVVDDGATGTQSIDINYDFDAQNNGQAGVGYREIVAVGRSDLDFAGQAQESGNLGLDGDETVTLVSQSYDPSGNVPPTGFGTNDAQHLLATVRAAGLDAGEALIVRIDVRFACFASPVTGNLHAALDSAEVTGGGGGDNISVGQQDIPMLGIGDVATASPTPTSTNTPEPTSTHTPEPTSTHTPEPTSTHTPLPTSTNTPEPTSTNTPLPTSTNTPLPTSTNTPQSTSTSTSRTATPTRTGTPLAETPASTPTGQSGVAGAASTPTPARPAAARLPDTGAGWRGDGPTGLAVVAVLAAAGVGIGVVTLGLRRRRS